MKQLNLTRGVTYVLHILFWLGYGALLYASLSGWGLSEREILTSVLSDVFTSVTISYFNLLVLLPRLYERGKYGLYIGSALTLIVALVLLRVNILPLAFSRHPLYYIYFIRTLPIVGFYLFTTLIWSLNNLVSARRREVELKNSQLDSELKFLKLQLSPHFLFNTLNNIYSMAYFNDANTAPAILKLSGMMRHMLHEGQDKFILLTKEISFMENFIELWRLKLDENPTIVFTHTGVTEGHRIAPLIFLAFLENAFKHGNTMNGTISITLDVSKDELLHFNIKNDVIDVPNTLDEKSGVGLSNVRKRLDLIYPGKHQLTLLPNPNSFEVNLTIELA